MYVCAYVRACACVRACLMHASTWMRGRERERTETREETCWIFCVRDGDVRACVRACVCVRAQCENATFEFGSGFFRGECRTCLAITRRDRFSQRIVKLKAESHLTFVKWEHARRWARKRGTLVDFQGFQTDTSLQLYKRRIEFSSRDLGERREREFVA